MKNEFNQLKGIFKWGHIALIVIGLIILIGLCLYIIIYSEKKLMGLILLGVTLTFIQYKKRTLTFIILEKCWQKIKYGW